MSGNGVDLAAIYQAVLALDRKFERKFEDLSNQIATLRGEVGSLRGDVGSLRGEVGSLREEVGGYHGSVVGHGILISELDERVTQLEQGERPSSS